MNPPKSSFTSNPFRAARLRPGTIDYLFPDGCSAPQLLDKLTELGGWAQIIGPHGSGKSTLLHALCARLASQGQQAQLVELRNAQRWLPCGWRSPLAPDPDAVVMVDGYEQLTRAARLWLKLHCWRHGWRLIVTSHDAVGLPTLYETRVDGALAAAVVRALSGDHNPRHDLPRLEALLARHHGNLRELLFDLYDQYEQSAGEHSSLNRP